jgi:hypothetical protein
MHWTCSGHCFQLCRFVFFDVKGVIFCHQVLMKCDKPLQAVLKYALTLFLVGVSTQGKAGLQTACDHTWCINITPLPLLNTP